MYTRLSGQSITLLMGTLKMYSNAYDFTALENYFNRINKWKGLTPEEFSEIYGTALTMSEAMQRVIELLEEKNR